MPSPKTKTFTIRKQAADILDVRTDIDLTAPASVAEMLDSRGRLPASVDAIRLSEVRLGVSAGDKAITFGSGGRKVAFSAEAGAFGAMGAYRDQSAMLADLAEVATGDANARIPLDEIPFPTAAAARYFVLYAGYGASASANGSVALGPAAAASFNAHGGRRRAFAVIQAHAQEPRVDRAVRGVAGAWRLPRQIGGADDLPPGTWIVAEVAGGLEAGAGVTFGLDFNWVRSVKAGGLEGDIGLKIQAGANAAFGLSVSDRYAVVVGRDSLDESERKVRVRLHRLNERGWSFAASANLSLTGSTGKLLPKQLDDFIAATLGVHGLQTLEEVRRWTDPSERLSEVAAEFLDGVAKKRFNGTLAKKFDEVRAEVLDWFNKWDELPGEAASALWDISRLEERKVKDFVKRIRKLADADEKTVQAEVAKLVARTDFAETPLGLWLEKIATGRVVGVLANLPQAKAVSEAATKTLDILDGGLLEDLKEFVETRVGLPPVRAAIKKNDFKTLNAKLKKKLAEFLGRSRLDSKAIQSIRETVATLDKRGGEIYSAAVKALNDTYRFTFDYAIQQSVTKTALLDVTFDFGAARASEAKLSALLRAAIGGDFRGVLPPPGKRAPAGVSFAEAALTHHMQRSASVKITLPFFSSETIKQTSALASFRLAPEEGGVYLYALDAKDEVQRVGKWRSSLSLGMSLQVGEGSNVRRHDHDDAGTSLDYRFERRLPQLQTVHLERLLDVVGPAYFPHQIGGPAAPEKPSAREWAAALDKTSDGETGERDDGLIGDARFELDVSLPGEAVSRWLHAPLDKKDPLYMDVSRRIQTLLRRYIPFLYFQEANNYADLQPAFALLVYSALPVTTSIRARDGKVIELNTNEDVFWDWVSASTRSQRMALLLDSDTATRLAGKLDAVAKALASEHDRELRKLTRRYARSELGTVLKAVLDGPGQTLLESLLGNETTVIARAVKAGAALAKFQDKSDDPEKSVEALADFGAKITKTFHGKLQSIFKPKEAADREVLRNLGALLFSEVSEVFPPSTPVRPAARLELSVFQQGSEKVILRQALVEV